MFDLFISSCPPVTSKITKDEIKDKKLNKEISARTTDGGSTKADEMHVMLSPKPNAACSSIDVCPSILDRYAILKDRKHPYFFVYWKELF